MLRGWLCSSPGHLVSLPPAAGLGPCSMGGDSAVAALSIVTGLGHHILLITGLSYVCGPLAQPCLLSWLLGEPSSLGPVPTAQGWQSPQGSSPCPALSPTIPSPDSTPPLPLPQCRNRTIRQSAVWDQQPRGF